MYNHLVPKLNGTSYATWKSKMEMLLIREGHWSIVSQRKLRPTATTGTGTRSAYSSSRTRRNTTEPTNDKDDAALEWDENAERATATIFLYLDEHVEHAVIDIRNPVELWEKLKTIYERK
jgi:hypothetical protein